MQRQALREIASLRAFAHLSLSEPIPDETTILNFRHLLEENDLAADILAGVNKHLQRKGLLLKKGKGDMIVVRYADDLVMGFEHEADARRFWDAMRMRFEKFSLELHGDKTRLLEFGRYAIERRRRNGQGKPQTFNFLGSTFISGRSRRGAFLLRRHTRCDRMRAALREIKDEMRRRSHDSLADQGLWLRSVVTGYFAYHAVPTNAQAIGAYRHHVIDLWRRSLRRRSHKDRMTWARIVRLATEWLPPPHVLHPWPYTRNDMRRSLLQRQNMQCKPPGCLGSTALRSRKDLLSTSAEVRVVDATIGHDYAALRFSL